MTNQTNEALSYIEREYENVKGRVELQRRVVAQLQLVEAFNALLEDEASKLHILNYLRKWLGDKLDVAPVKEVAP